MDKYPLHSTGHRPFGAAAQKGINQLLLPTDGQTDGRTEGRTDQPTKRVMESRAHVHACHT